MRVICAYSTNLAGERAPYPETREALEADGIEAEYVYVGGSPTAYHELLARVWAEGQGFVNVEQDIVVRPGLIRELEACPEAYCGAPYAISTTIGSWLGCVRFSDVLVTGWPSVFNAIDSLLPDGTPRKYWGRLDTRLKQVLESHLGLTMHLHWPAVEHLNPAQRPPIYTCSACGLALPWEVVREEPPWRCPRCG